MDAAADANRAATQLKFNDLLEKFRTDVLSEDLPWNEMTEEERNSVKGHRIRDSYALHPKPLLEEVMKRMVFIDLSCCFCQKECEKIKARLQRASATNRTETKKRTQERFELAKQKQIEKLEKLVNEIQVWSLWQTTAEVESGLKRISTQKDRFIALKTTLNFRKNVLKQTGPPYIFNFTKKAGDKRVNLTVQELSGNLKSLVVRVQTIPIDNTEPVVILGRKVQHAFKENDSTVWYIGQIISQ
ncbi:hypothetical protein MAR_013726, partial [Mya arenaria]